MLVLLLVPNVATFRDYPDFVRDENLKHLKRRWNASTWPNLPLMDEYYYSSENKHDIKSISSYQTCDPEMLLLQTRPLAQK